MSCQPRLEYPWAKSFLAHFFSGKDDKGFFFGAAHGAACPTVGTESAGLYGACPCPMSLRGGNLREPCLIKTRAKTCLKSTTVRRNLIEIIDVGHEMHDNSSMSHEFDQILMINKQSTQNFRFDMTSCRSRVPHVPHPA